MKRALGACVALMALGVAQAQQPAAPAGLNAQGGKKGGQKKGGATAATPSPELENVLKAINALSPEQHEQFRQNLFRWVNLSPEDKKALRDVQEVRRQHMQEEIEEAIKETGLQLDPPRRQAFVRRYTEERKKIEEGLRAETELKRQPKVAELRQRMKAEFTAPQASNVPGKP